MNTTLLPDDIASVAVPSKWLASVLHAPETRVTGPRLRFVWRDVAAVRDTLLGIEQIQAQIASEDRYSSSHRLRAQDRRCAAARLAEAVLNP